MPICPQCGKEHENYTEVYCSPACKKQFTEARKKYEREEKQRRIALLTEAAQRAQESREGITINPEPKQLILDESSFVAVVPKSGTVMVCARKRGGIRSRTGRAQELSLKEGDVVSVHVRVIHRV